MEGVPIAEVSKKTAGFPRPFLDQETRCAFSLSSPVVHMTKFVMRLSMKKFVHFVHGGFPECAARVPYGLQLLPGAGE